jgi:hypothetical protein
MSIQTVYKIVFAFIIISFLVTKANAQDQNLTVNQDPKFEQLLNEKRKINTSLILNNSYKIQIYNGNSEVAKKTLSDFKQRFNDIDATIVFNTPNYKVWVGNFRSRIEAERNLVAIKDRYKNVLLIKPSR